MGKSSGKKSDISEEVSIGETTSVPLKKPGGTLFLRNPLVHIVFIILLGILAYSNTFQSPFHWDDKAQISENPIIKNLDNFTLKGFEDTPRSDYNPRRYVGYFTFALNYRLGGLEVIGYHIGNLLIHLINGILVYFLVLLTFGTPYFRGSGTSDQGPVPGDQSPVTIHDSRFISLFAALLFVSHPIQTQAVTYIVQRYASLATLFYLASLVFYIKGRLASYQAIKPASGEGGKQASWQAGKLASLFLSVIFALLAMRTKEIAFTLPMVTALYEFTFFRAFLKKKLLVLLSVALVLLIILTGLIYSGKPLGKMLSDVSEMTRLQTQLPRWDYLMTEMRVIVTYIRLIFVPLSQNLDYDYPVYHSFFTPPVFLSFLFLSALFGVAIYLLYRSRPAGKLAGSDAGKLASWQAGKHVGEDGSHDSLSTVHLSRLIAFGILWFFITLLVESSIIPIADVIFEHRLYLPSVGLLIAVATGLFVALKRLKSERLFLPALVLLPLVLSGMSYARNRVWMTDTGLWEDVVRKSPNKARAHNDLGYVYLKKDRLDEAFREFQIAVELNPDYVEAHTNLGIIYFMKGRVDEALKEYQTALTLYPDYLEAHTNLGNLYFAQDRLDEALKEYQTALKIYPGFVEAHNNLGSLYFVQGKLDEALKEYQTALKLNPYSAEALKNLENLYSAEARKDREAAVKSNPDSAGAHNDLGTAYYRQGLADKAVKEYQAALKIDPDYAEAHNNLGILYFAQGRFDEALKAYQTALKLKPDSPEVHNNLGKLYGKQGRLDLALREFQAAVRIKSDSADAHNGLGNVYGLQGRLDEAIKEYKTALKLNPDFADAHNNLGTVYLKQDRLDAALSEFQSASKLNPDDPGVRHNLKILSEKKRSKQ